VDRAPRYPPVASREPVPTTVGMVLHVVAPRRPVRRREHTARPRA